MIRLLRELRHDVLSVKEALRGEHDAVVLAQARLQGRLVLTFDKDFGALAFHARLPAECGVVLFRLKSSEPDTLARKAVEVLESRSDCPGHFSVVTEKRVRQRPLPRTGGGQSGPP